MSNRKASRGPISSHTVLTLALAPSSEGTLVWVTSQVIGIGARPRRGLTHWYLTDTVESLAGLPTHDVLCRLVNSLLRSLESGADSHSRNGRAVGTGAPLGATGGTVTTDVRQRVQPTLDTLSDPFPELSPFT